MEKYGRKRYQRI